MLFVGLKSQVLSYHLAELLSRLEASTLEAALAYKITSGNWTTGHCANGYKSLKTGIRNN